jgi:hypothetical protein
MGVANEKGMFEVPGVLPAVYSLFVSGPVSGYMVVDAGNDLTNLQIVGLKGIDIPVHVVFDDGAGLIPLPTPTPGAAGPRTVVINGQSVVLNPTAPPTTSLRVVLTHEPGTGSPTGVFVLTAGWPGVPSNTISPPIQAVPEGFMLRSVSLGDYRMGVSGLAQGSYIKSIHRGLIDVLRDGLRVSGPADDPIEIVIGANAGVLTGHVVNDSGSPVPNVTVALVPSPQRRSRVDLYQSVSTDANGAFKFQGIVPDDYKLFSWEDIVQGAWHDQDFLNPYENRGLAVTVDPGANAPQELKVIPWTNP